MPKLARDAFENGTRALAKIYELKSNNLILDFLKAITQYSINYLNYSYCFIVYSQYSGRRL